MNQKHQSKNFFAKLFTKRKNIPASSSIITKNLLLDYYISFVKNHPDIILVIALDGEVIAHNQNKDIYLGYHHKKNIISKEHMEEDEYDRLLNAFNKAKKGISSQIDFSMTNRQGKHIHFIGNFIPISTAHQEVDAVTLILKDFTDHKQLQKEYELKVNHLEQAQNIATFGSFEYIISEKTFHCSEECYHFSGMKKSDATVENLFSIIHPEDFDHVQYLFDRAINTGKGYKTEYRIFHTKTKELLYMNTKVKVVNENNRPYKLVGVIQDITKSKQLYLQLKETNERFHHIFNHLHVGIWMQESLDKEVSFASKGLENILQITVQEIYKNPLFMEELILPEYKDQTAHKYGQLKNGSNVEHQFRITDGKGTTKWIYEQLIPSLDINGNVTQIFGLIVDVSHETELVDKLDFISKNDQLTSLPNQHSLYEKLDEFIFRDDIKKFAILSLDIDNFNWINNYLGYDIGDKVLQSISNRLIKLRSENSYLARVASDSFVYIFANFEQENDVLQLAKEIKQSIKSPFFVKKYELYVTSSIGISLYPENGMSKLTLLENSNNALLYAKELGKNNIQVFSLDRNLETHKKYVLELDLRKAIQNEDFELFYQPKVDPKSGAIKGAEALIRWPHKDWGLISPAEFIPIAEEKHLIHHIGNFVIKTVCAQLRAWKDRDKELYPISINISPNRFLRNDLVDVIKSNLETYQVDPKYIEFEITEGILLRNEVYVSDAIKQLKEIGVNISLDDFGSGHTSFLYLQNFNIDTLKIDKKFIQHINSEDNKSTAIITSLLHLAKGLNMNVVVEGVEEYEQLEFLKQKECEAVQGFIYSKAVPLEQFEKLIAKQYLKPKRKSIKPEKERREFFRFHLPHYLPVKLKVTELNKKRVNVGSANVLVENISIGGLRMLTTLKLPVISNMKLNFTFNIMNESFNLNGILVYYEEETIDIFAYGIAFENTSEGDKDQLAKVINRMTTLKRLDSEIINTEFIKVSPTKYFKENWV